RAGSEREAVDVLEYRRREVLQRADAHRRGEEEDEAHPDGADAQELERRRSRRGLFVRVVRRWSGGAPEQERDRCQRAESDRAGGDGGDAPPGERREAGHEDRRGGPAEVAGKTVRRECVTQ